MKTIKIKLISCLILIINFSGISAQTKQDFIISNLAQQQKWFEVRDYFSQNKDSISITNNLGTKSYLDTYFNNPESAITNIGILLNQYSKEIDMFNYGLLLIKNLAEVQKYDEAINLLNDILEQVGSALPKAYFDDLNLWKASLEFYKKHPYRVVFDERNSSETDFELRDTGISLDSKVNGVELPILFDTGFSSSRISKETADKIGIHTYFPDTIYANSRIRLLKGIIDSIEIGNVKIYNCPIDVSFEKRDFSKNEITQDNKERVLNYIDSSSNINVIGLSTLKLIDIINLDFLKRKLSFKEAKSATQTPANLFIINNSPFLYTTLNNQPFVSVFDIGAEGTFLNKEYYDKNKEYFNLKDEQLYKITAYGFDTLATIEYKKLDDIVLNTHNRHYNLTNAMVGIKTPFMYVPDVPVPDGIIGNDFLKLLKSMRLDFKNMCLTFE